MALNLNKNGARLIFSRVPKTMRPSFYFTLLALLALTADLAAGELLIDFVPKAAGEFFADGPELKLSVSFDKEGNPAHDASESPVPVGVFGHCPEVAGATFVISVKAIGLIDTRSGRDTGLSLATDITTSGPGKTPRLFGGLGVISPTDIKKNYFRSDICNVWGKSEGVLMGFDLTNIPRTVRLRVTEITLWGVGESNDAFTLFKIGGVGRDYVLESTESLQSIDLIKADLTLKGESGFTPLFSFSPAGVGSNFRFADFRLEFEKITSEP